MIKRFFIHPLLISVYAVLYLYSSNISQMSAQEASRSFVAAVILPMVLLIPLKIFTKDWYKAALIDSVGLILFFSYGHVMDLVRDLSIGPVLIGRTAVVGPIWIILFMVSAWSIFRTQKPMEISGVFNAIALFLLIVPLYTVGSSYIQTEVIRHSQVSGSDASPRLEASKESPDIYYIIFDMHGRADVHKSLYGYDESWFIDALEKRGFYIADKSTSNYSSTLPSVSSSLNMEYINYLEDSYAPDAKTREPYKLLLDENKLFQIFREKGYRIGTFDTNFNYTKFPDEDVYLKPSSYELQRYQNFLALNSFEGLLVHSTFLRTLDDLSILSLDSVQEKTIETPYHIHRLTLLNIFNHLPDLAHENERYFVFAHVVSPHPPYIFGPDGEEIKHEDVFSLGAPGRQDGGSKVIKQYTDQLNYIDTLILRAVDQILASSKIPPIIILQGDHGPYSYFGENDVMITNMQEQHGILNAYYFPNHQYDLLYPSITPVNSFRVVFNTFFGEKYDLLPDKNYYHSHDQQYNFIDVTDRVKTDPLIH